MGHQMRWMQWHGMPWNGMGWDGIGWFRLVELEEAEAAGHRL